MNLMLTGIAAIVDANYVLRQFNKKERTARKIYREFVDCGSKTRRADLTGGGLVISSGGWDSLTEKLSKGIKARGDERILGGSEFVERVLSEAEEELSKSLKLKLSGFDINKLALRINELLGVNPLQSPGRYKESVKGRRVFSYWGVRLLGITGAELARRLGISQAAVSKAIREGEKVVSKERLSLEPKQ
jgi:putative transposase